MVEAHQINSCQPWLTCENRDVGCEIAIKLWNPCQNKLWSPVIMNQILKVDSGKKINLKKGPKKDDSSKPI
jgi:hypothetical protein